MKTSLDCSALNVSYRQKRLNKCCFYCTSLFVFVRKKSKYQILMSFSIKDKNIHVKYTWTIYSIFFLYDDTNIYFCSTCKHYCLMFCEVNKCVVCLCTPQSCSHLQHILYLTKRNHCILPVCALLNLFSFYTHTHTDINVVKSLHLLI